MFQRTGLFNKRRFCFFDRNPEFPLNFLKFVLVLRLSMETRPSWFLFQSIARFRTQSKNHTTRPISRILLQKLFDMLTFQMHCFSGTGKTFFHSETLDDSKTRPTWGSRFLKILLSCRYAWKEKKNSRLLFYICLKQQLFLTNLEFAFLTGTLNFRWTVWSLF